MNFAFAKLSERQVSARRNSTSVNEQEAVKHVQRTNFLSTSKGIQSMQISLNEVTAKSSALGTLGPFMSVHRILCIGGHLSQIKNARFFT